PWVIHNSTTRSRSCKDSRRNIRSNPWKRWRARRRSSTRRRRRAVFADEKVLHYIVQMIHATRENCDIMLGGSPRASMALLHCAQAFAAIQGFDFVSPGDVKRLAPYVLGHRLILTPERRSR